MRRLVLSLLIGGLATLALVRCSSYATVPPEPIADGATDGTVDAAEEPPDTRVGCDPTCAGSAGPCGVRVERRCIDSTEVTVGDFRPFANLARDGGIDAGAPCPLVRPTAIGNVIDDHLPMTNVDMCTARAFCRWAGKHLCGAVDGGTLPRGQERTQTGAWYHACTGGYDLVASHLVDDAGCVVDAAAPADVGTTCQGGVHGLSEMIGNVWEWIDVTDRPDGSATAEGVIMGGGYRTGPADCTSLRIATTIALASDDIGFRCCSP